MKMVKTMNLMKKEKKSNDKARERLLLRRLTSKSTSKKILAISIYLCYTILES